MIIGVIDIKGGVGKTTSSLAIATAAQRSGLSVTVVDTDPQGSATLWAQAAEDADDPLPFPVVSKNQAEIRRMRERRPDRNGELMRHRHPAERRRRGRGHQNRRLRGHPHPVLAHRPAADHAHRRPMPGRRQRLRRAHRHGPQGHQRPARVQDRRRGNTVPASSTRKSR